MPTAARLDASAAPAGGTPNLYIAWFEAWRAEQDARREAEAAAKRQMQREIRWMVAALVAWAVLAAMAGGLCLLFWTAA